MLWRAVAFDATVAQPLKGTETAVALFWSPDSKFLAFVAGGKLKKIDVAGGPPQTIPAEAATPIQGGSWGPERRPILFLPPAGNGPLRSIACRPQEAWSAP